MAKQWVWWPNIQYGKKNKSVLILQTHLAKEVSLDFSSGPGSYGPATKAAVQKLQTRLYGVGSAADGLIGISTLRYLANKHNFDVKGVSAVAGVVTGTGVRPSSPVPGYGVNYPYGVRNSNYAAGFHTGEDRAAPTGTPVVAVRSGKIVVSNGGGGAYGNWIQLLADNGRVYMYAHLSSRSVSPGQSVKAGQQLGRVGTTGNSTGPHLHFEMSKGSTWRYGYVQKPTW